MTQPMKIDIERRRDGWYVVYHHIAGGPIKGLPMTFSQGPYLTRWGARRVAAREAKEAEREIERETVWEAPPEPGMADSRASQEERRS